MDIVKKLPGVKKNILLADYTTYKIGGKAKYFFEAESKESLSNAVEAARALNLPIYILGGGSNLLFDEKGFAGLVIKIESAKYKILDAKNGLICAESGLELAKLVEFAFQNSLSGLEWAAGIPGTVGGAIYGNVQAFNSRISELIESAEVLDLNSVEIKNLRKRDCGFATKNSVFKKGKKLIIISAVFKLEKGNKMKIKEKMEEFLAYRKSRHPSEYSAGSVFVNSETEIRDKKLLKEFPIIKEFNEKGVIPSAFLIESCGLKGKMIGKAQISEQHANFIINKGGAKAKDVLALIKLARKKVKEKFNLLLEVEIQYVNFK